MLFETLPAGLAGLIAGRTVTKDQTGCSSAGVYRLDGDGVPLWLKIEETGQELIREQAVLRWLKGRLPVPEVLYFGIDDRFEYLLETNMPGEMACSENMLASPVQTVRLLAEGLRMLQAVDISACSLDNRLEAKLAAARKNIDLGLVDVSDWESDNMHGTPENLYQYLCSHRPAAEDVSFTHGDYCLPNILIQNGAVGGLNE
jgi:aminoglycoside 3'-phosphotransferase III